MKKRTSPPVVAFPTEGEIATIPGARRGTAMRVHFAGGPESQVRLEHLAYSAALGWYVQKSFCIPGSMLAELIPQLRKADCLTPRRPKKPRQQLPQIGAPLPFPGPGSASKSA